MYSSPLQLRNTLKVLSKTFRMIFRRRAVVCSTGGEEDVGDEFRSRMVALIPRLRRFAVALTGDLDQADDLVQELVRVPCRGWRSGRKAHGSTAGCIELRKISGSTDMRSKKVRGEHVPLEVDDIPGADGARRQTVCHLPPSAGCARLH